MQFLYADGSNYVFMDQTTYEQIAVPSDVVGENVNYLKENMVIGILLFNGKAAGLELPTFVELRVKETMPGVKGDTASNTTKPATLETGAVVNVPLFIGNDELIKVDTRTGSYAERVKR
jgi:elongation factor P